MNDLATQFWPVLWRTTVTLTLAALSCGLILRPARPRSPLVHRVGWLATLLVGWSLLRLTVPVAWYDAPQAAPTHAIDATLATSLPKPLPTVAQPTGEAPWDARPIAWPAIAMLFWGLGMAGLMGTWSVGYARFVRRLPEEQPAEPDWDAQWCGLLAAAGVRRAIRLRVTADVGPLLCRRLGGYELMIPAELWRDWNVAQREAILRHELAHYLRGDVWKSLAARVLMLPHWFNPAAWWAVRRFDEAGEWACDQMVLGYTPASSYAQTLLKLGEQVAFGHSPGLAARGASLAVRIRRLLLSPGGNESKWNRGAMIAAICLAATLALLRVELVAKEPAVQKRQAEESPRTADATAILDQPGESGEPAAGKEVRDAADEALQRRLSMVVPPDRKPGDPATSPPVPLRNPNAPGATPYQGPTYPLIPNYVNEPSRAGRTRTFRGPRGEMFETDGLHLWRLEGPGAAYMAPRYESEAAPYATPATPGYQTAPPGTPFRFPSTGESEGNGTSTGNDVVEPSEDELGELLQHDFGKSAGKRSLAGGGHAVRFEAPDEDRLLTSVRIFGSRYGLPQAPDEDFHVWLCDETMHALAQFDLPYATFERGDPKWVRLKINPTKVPKKFIICIGFNPEQTKGVYVHYDDPPVENSLTGLPGKEPKVFSAGNWMIRVTLASPRAARAE